ncbi:MAG: hypothetical protein JF924_06280 [Candidatus Dormibacteraeota bacterium]|nr:hypothetical protein [Candidatus Dormibacteraeota bacterium]
MAFGESSGVSRRKFLRGAATASAAAIAGRGVYSVLDGFAGPTRVEAATNFYWEEQYLVPNIEVIGDNGVTVAIPPIYNDVFTAKLSPNLTNKSQLQSAQRRLESAFKIVEGPYQPSASGLTMVISWGLPYFENYVKTPWQQYAPVDLAASASGTKTLAVLDAKLGNFPSDPKTVKFEDNHVAIKIRSDSSAIVASVENQLFIDTTSPAYIGDLLVVTSRRIGFAGRGFGTTSAAKALAVPAGIAGATSIPDNAQLMMGFTSTQTDALGPDNVASFETLRGLTDQYDQRTNTFKYFARGTTMHLSHLYIDLASWYGKNYAERVGRMFSPSTPVPTSGQPVTIPNGIPQVATRAQVTGEAANGKAGHNSLLQQATRFPGRPWPDNYGRMRPKGMAIPVREDFNTIDDPFAMYLDDYGNRLVPTTNRAGLHFAVFVPTSDRFHRARRAMDGVFPDDPGFRTRYGLTDDKVGFNSLIQTTHRQNFLVPPRKHRSFPLAELL